MDRELFVRNRKKIFELMEDNSILLSFSRRKVFDSVTNDKYDVDRNYYYLSGVFEYENIVMLVKNNKKTNEIIFINPYDDFKAKWVGAPLSKEEIKELSGIEDIRYLDSFEDYLNYYLKE
jgi:Xaa-Pro aminopeptidase